MAVTTTLATREPDAAPAAPSGDGSMTTESASSPLPAALPPAAVPRSEGSPTATANASTPATPTPAVPPAPQASTQKLLVSTPGGGSIPLSLADYPNAQHLPTSRSAKQPAVVLDPSSIPSNNDKVLRATGMLSGPANPQLVQEIWERLRSSGYLKPNQPTNAPSLVVFLPDDALPGTQRPHFVSAQPDKGHAPETPLPTRIRVGAAASFTPGSGQLSGEANIGVSSGSTAGLPREAPGTSAERVTTQTISGRAGYNGGPLAGVGFDRSTRTVKTAGGALYDERLSSTAVTAGWSLRGGPTATVSLTQGSRGPDPLDQRRTEVTAGFQATGPVANVKIETPSVSIQAGFNKLYVLGFPFPGIGGATVTFRTRDKSHQWVVDVPTGTVLKYGPGEGNAALTLGVVVVGPWVAPVAFPGPDAVPQQRLKLPPEVVQAINAREQSAISARYLDNRVVRTLEQSQTPDVVRAHLFEKASGGVSALGPDGESKSRQQLETELWNTYRERHRGQVTPLETAASSTDERIAKNAQEKLEALRSTALQPLGQLATPIAPTFMPANASAHVFPRGEIPKQTELLKNFAQVTGVSPTNPDGSVKPPEVLFEAVWTWFKENNKTLVTALEERAASTDTAVAQDAQRRIESIRQVAIVAVAEPEIPTPDELRTSIRQQQQRELRQTRGGAEKPWERRIEDNPIGYRRPYDDKFSINADHSVKTANANGKATATSRLTLEVSTPDTAAPLSPHAQRTGIADRPQKTFGVTYEQEIALSSQAPAIVTRHQINQDLKGQETRLLQQFHKTLSAAARQGGSVDQTAESLISNLPIRDITPRGDVTAQQLSLRIPGQGTLALRASHTVEVITPANGAPSAVVQIVLETNRSGAPRSVATWEQVVPLTSDRPPEAAAAAVRAQLYRSIVGEGQSDGILKTASRNGLAALLRNAPFPKQLAPGFVTVTREQSPRDRVAALIAKNQNLPADGQGPTGSRPTP